MVEIHEMFRAETFFSFIHSYVFFSAQREKRERKERKTFSLSLLQIVSLLPYEPGNKNMQNEQDHFSAIIRLHEQLTLRRKLL